MDDEHSTRVEQTQFLRGISYRRLPSTHIDPSEWQLYLSKPQIQCLHLYKSSAYEQINNYLRTGVFIEGEYFESAREITGCVEHIDKAMRPLGHTQSVHRCFTCDVEKMRADGYEMLDPAYMSTSTRVSGATKFHKPGEQNCLVSFMIPRNTPVHKFFYGDEDEILVSRGHKLCEFDFRGVKTDTGMQKYCFCATLRKMEEDEVQRARRINSLRAETISMYENEKRRRDMETLDEFLESLGDVDDS